MKVLYSINRPHTDNIKSGRKLWEIRKSKPNIPVPFPAFIYETKKKGGCGKVIGEFICDKVYEIKNCGSQFLIDKDIALTNKVAKESCLDFDDMLNYLKTKDGYGLHISNLKIYDKPKELSEFYKPFKYDGDGIICGTREEMNDIYEFDCETVFGKIYPDFSLKDFDCKHCPKARDFYRLTRPPQSWCYVEEII